MLPLCNLVFNNNGYLWNGFIYKENPNVSRRNLENIVSMAIVAEDEMNTTIERAVNAIKKIDIYYKKIIELDEYNIPKNIEKTLLISGDNNFNISKKIIIKEV